MGLSSPRNIETIRLVQVCLSGFYQRNLALADAKDFQSTREVKRGLAALGLRNFWYLALGIFTGYPVEFVKLRIWISTST